MSDDEVKILAWRLTLIPCGLAGMATFHQGWTAVVLVGFVGTIAYGCFSSVLQVVAIRTMPSPKANEEQETAVQPVADDTPTPAPLTVRMVAPPVREKPRVNGNHLRQLIDAMNEGQVDPNAVSLNSLNKAGVTRFNNNGGANSDAGQLLAYLIEKEAVTPYGQAYAAKQQPYIWRGLDIEL